MWLKLQSDVGEFHFRVRFYTPDESAWDEDIRQDYGWDPDWTKNDFIMDVGKTRYRIPMQEAMMNEEVEDLRREIWAFLHNKKAKVGQAWPIEEIAVFMFFRGEIDIAEYISYFPYVFIGPEDVDPNESQSFPVIDPSYYRARSKGIKRLTKWRDSDVVMEIRLRDPFGMEPPCDEDIYLYFNEENMRAMGYYLDYVTGNRTEEDPHVQELIAAGVLYE